LALRGIFSSALAALLSILSSFVLRLESTGLQIFARLLTCLWSVKNAYERTDTKTREKPSQSANAIVVVCHAFSPLPATKCGTTSPLRCYNPKSWGPISANLALRPGSQHTAPEAGRYNPRHLQVDALSVLEVARTAPDDTDGTSYR